MGVSVWQTIIVLFYIFLIAFPIAKILGRLGFSRLWCIVAIVPVLNLVGLWALAYVDWPIAERLSDPRDSASS